MPLGTGLKNQYPLTTGHFQIKLSLPSNNRSQKSSKQVVAGSSLPSDNSAGDIEPFQTNFHVSSRSSMTHQACGIGDFWAKDTVSPMHYELFLQAQSRLNLYKFKKASAGCGYWFGDRPGLGRVNLVGQKISCPLSSLKETRKSHWCLKFCPSSGTNKIDWWVLTER